MVTVSRPTLYDNLWPSYNRSNLVIRLLPYSRKKFLPSLQLAPNGISNVTVGGFPIIRWAQTANYGYAPNKRMENVFMAVAIDLGDPDSPHTSIHPRDKQDVGARLTIGARHVAYNDSDVYYLGMLPQSAKLGYLKKKTACDF